MTTTVFEPHWRGMSGIFGGFVLARFVDGANSIEGFEPMSVTIQFVSSVAAGPAELRTDVLHRGRQTASLRLELHQKGHLRAHGTSLLVPRGGTPNHARRLDLSMVPGPEGLEAKVWEGQDFTYVRNLEIRPVAPNTLAGGSAGWLRLSRPGPLLQLDSPHAIASVFLDALRPGLYAGPRPPLFVPSIDFTAHFSPALSAEQSEWYYGINELVWADERYCVEESTLCLPDGTVVAQVRQSRTILWPEVGAGARPAPVSAEERTTPLERTT